MRDGEEHCGGEGKCSIERAEHEMRVYGRNGLVRQIVAKGVRAGEVVAVIF